MAKFKSRVVKTPPFVLSYPHLVEPQHFEPEKPGDEPKAPKYSCVAVFDAKADLSELKKLCAEARDGYFKTKPRGMRDTFRKNESRWEEGPDGKLIPMPGYPAGGTFVTLMAGMDKPDCRDQRMIPIVAASVLYPGAICRAAVTAGGYDSHGNKGVTIYLQALQKVAEGDNIAGRVKAEDYFDVVPELAGDSTQGGTNADEFGNGAEDEDENF